MFGLSEKIIQELTDITRQEEKQLPQWIAKKYVANCVIPTLSGENHVHCNVAVVAPVSAGKSTLFNALCGYPILPVASKTTSSVPTYITRANEQSRECVTVYGIKKVKDKKDDLEHTRFEKDENTKRTFFANDISRDMFKDLFEYMYFVTHGVPLEEDGYEYMTTVENVAYFMKNTDKTDILFYGEDADKWKISNDDFALTYDNPRHRLLLLLILLCVYVNQDYSEEEMSEYTKQVNQQRKKLLQRYKFPVNSDYCVCLDWCSDNIPEDITLIDLPGTGSSTQDKSTLSSHTALVRGILTEADAVWVLCSDNGTVDIDLTNALTDAIEGNTRKNKVCIYNCKNKEPNDSGPVTAFLEKLPFLTGERCYVVNARAGEYMYIQNGVSALMTKTASDKRCNDYEEPSENGMTKKLEVMYKGNGENLKYCAYTTSKDRSGKSVATQDKKHKYTLETFFKNALTEYIERLKYEVALNDTIEQANFFVYLRNSLSSSRSILEGIDGKGEEISKTVNEALKIAKKQALDKYVQQAADTQRVMAVELATLGDDIGERIKGKFVASLAALIENIKAEWRTLEQEGHPNCLKANIIGDYPLRDSNANSSKFRRVRSNAESMITISAFEGALSVADTEIQKYNALLHDYVDDLKKITNDFVNDYIHAFLSSFDKKRDELCKANDSMLTDEIYQKFNATREQLKTALQDKLNATCKMVCDSFDILTDTNGLFDTLCRDTEKIFRERFCENILDAIRKFMYDTFTGTNYKKWFFNFMRPANLHKILEDDFGNKKAEYTERLSRLIDAMYGVNAGDANFPSGLSAMVNKFNADKIANGAQPEIEKVHENISSLVGFGANLAVNVTQQIEELDQAIETWTDIGERYKNVDAMLVDSDAKNTKKLYEDCKNAMAAIVSESKN